MDNKYMHMTAGELFGETKQYMNSEAGWGDPAEELYREDTPKEIVEAYADYLRIRNEAREKGIFID